MNIAEIWQCYMNIQDAKLMLRQNIFLDSPWKYYMENVPRKKKISIGCQRKSWSV